MRPRDPSRNPAAGDGHQNAMAMAPHNPSKSAGRHAIVLAAGKGTRFKSSRSKVLHPLCGKPLLMHVLERLHQIGVQRTFLVVGPESQEVRQLAQGAPAQLGIEFIQQSEQLGTGHAVQMAAPDLDGLGGSLLVLYADTPLIRSSTLQQLVRLVEEEGADQALLTTHLEDPTGYGRILRSKNGQAQATVEEKDATADQRAITEVNSGFYCFKTESLLPALKRLGKRNRSGEYYLTDLLQIMRERGLKVETWTSAQPSETWGINDRMQLAEAEGLMRREIARRWMAQGVTMLDPCSVLIDSSVEIGQDAVLYPGVILEGRTRIGREAVVHAYCHLSDAEVGEGAVIDHCSVIRSSRVGARSQVGPFAHIRAGSRIGSNARVGNFVEVKKSRIDEGSKAAHLTYLGDAELGKGVNIGAGTITCNYDGVRKNKTVIEDHVFIGSNSQLVAPLKIGTGAYVAAGSTITESVPPGNLAIARSRQKNKPGWKSPQKRKEQKV